MNCAVRYLLIRLRRSQLVPPERHGPSLEIVQRCGAGLTLQDQGLGLGSRTDPVLSPSAGEWARGTSPQQWGLSPTSPLSLLPAFRPHFGETKAAPASQVEPAGDGKPAITATHTPPPRPTHLRHPGCSTLVMAPLRGAANPPGVHWEEDTPAKEAARALWPLGLGSCSRGSAPWAPSAHWAPVPVGSSHQAVGTCAAGFSVGTQPRGLLWTLIQYQGYQHASPHPA